jgi:hypothetical protein
MPLNILSKVVSEISDLPLKNADGSPMLDDNNTPVSATVFGPGSKVWQVADAAKRRKAIKRAREANGKLEATLDNEAEDTIEFLCSITKRFNNLDYPDVQGDKEIVRAVFSNPTLGFIREHMDADTHNWENFMQASRTVIASTQDRSLGSIPPQMRAPESLA